MQVFQLEAFGGPDALRLTTTADPPQLDDAVVVEARAIGVNFPDLLTTRGDIQGRPPLPTVPGREVAGVITRAPAGSGWAPGDAVCGYVDAGAYAEQVSVPLDRVMPLPDGADFATGAALVINYQTANFALVDRGRLRQGDAVLILGAAGGLGTAAVQVARAKGARVIAGVATEDQRTVALSAGAEAALVLTKDFSESVRSLIPSGVDIVLDPLGGTLTHEGMRCLAPEGRLLVLGFAAGTVPKISTNRLLLANTTLVGVAWTGPSRATTSSIADTGRLIGEMFEAGLLSPHIGSRFSFERLPEALHQLARGAISGKAVIEV